MKPIAGKTFFVTGATGFLGGHLVQHLSNNGASVRALARRPDRDAYIRDLPNVEIVMADLNEARRLIDYTAGCDIVLHAAAVTGTLAESRRVNVTGTRNMALAAVENDVQRFVHISTISVYGFKVDGDVTESTPPKASKDAYSITKLEGENALRAADDEYGLSYTIIRPGMIYGPRGTTWTKSVFKLAKRKPAVFIGRGRGSAQPIFVDDLCDLILTAAMHPGADRQTFNATPDPAPTWREFLGAYQQLAGNRWYLGVPPLLLSPVAAMIALSAKPHSTAKDIPDLLRYVQRSITYRTDRARDILGWTARTSLQDGVAACAPYLREKGLL